MQAVVKTDRRPGIAVLQVAEPEIRDSDILVKVLATSICGSDVHIYEGTPSYEWLPVPITLGHEFAGEVVAKGARVDSVEVGDRITARPGMACGRCLACQVGKGDLCTQRSTIGLTVNGSFAEYMRLSAGADIFKLPANLDAGSGALCEPLTISMNAVESCDIKPGQTAAVLGPGPIGLFALQALKLVGAGLVMVTGTGADGMRLDLARQLGADVIVNLDEEDPVATALKLTKTPFRAGLDFVFEATGNPKAVPQALSMVRPGGHVVVLGIHPAPAQIETTDLVRNSKTLSGSYSGSPDTWRRCLALLASGRLKAEPLISHRLPLAQAGEGFALASRRKACKVLLTP